MNAKVNLENNNSPQSWISDDFGCSDDDDDAFFKALDVSAATKKAKQNASSKPVVPPSSRQRPASSSCSLPWSLLHSPKASSQLAVHPKKVEEVRQWMANNRRGKRKV